MSEEQKVDSCAIDREFTEFLIKIYNLAAMTNIRTLCRTVFVGLLIAICGMGARAQYEDGSLIGSIHDATGAAVANASVTVTNVNSGVVIKIDVNGSGDYEIPSLRSGVYTIQASAPGFAPVEAKNITVSVGGRKRIDLTLKVGMADATTVEVSDLALQLETETSERGQTVSEYQTESLPLVSRNYSDLLGLVTGSRQAPTAATTTAVTSLVRQGSYNVNGLRSMFNNYLLDGMDNNAYGESNQGFDNQIIQPPPDSISEFQVVTNNESAEYGRSAGATINVASKSGGNQFHSTLYEFVRNTDLNAFGYIKPIAGTHALVKPGFNRNQFGADFGGPILKNRLFFFLDYEGFRQTLTPSVVLTVPTQNEINGILAVDVQDPLSPGTYYKAGTSILNSPDASPIAKKMRQRALTATTAPPTLPLPTRPTRATFASISSKTRRVPGSSRSATARRRASTIRRFRCRSTDKQTEGSRFSISKLRWVTRG